MLRLRCRLQRITAVASAQLESPPPGVLTMANTALAFGARLRELRLGRSLSQEQLADRCGLHRTFIGRVERGETNVTLGSIYKLARGLGVAPTDLLNQRMAK